MEFGDPSFGLFLLGPLFGPDGSFPKTVDAVLAIRQKYLDPAYVTPWAAQLLGRHWRESADRLETICRWSGGTPGCRTGISARPLRASLTAAEAYLDRRPGP